MGMKVKVLTPAMQHGEEADFHAQVLGVAGYGEQRFRRGGEQEIVGDLLVVESDGGDGFGQGEDYMEILGGQQLGATVLQPLFPSQALALGAMTGAAGA